MCHLFTRPRGRDRPPWSRFERQPLHKLARISSGLYFFTIAARLGNKSILKSDHSEKAWPRGFPIATTVRALVEGRDGRLSASLSISWTGGSVIAPAAPDDDEIGPRGEAPGLFSIHRHALVGRGGYGDESLPGSATWRF